jgi:dihydroorotate dehydrogenase electron transfer subunit
MEKVYEQATVRECTKIAEAGVFRLKLETAISRLVQPGQFVTLQPLVPGSIPPRPFTVYFAQRGQFIQIVFQVVGPNTQKYSQLKRGQKIYVLGPCGQPVVIDEEAELFILDAGGCGLASFYYPAHRILSTQETRVIIAAGFKTGQHAFGWEDFENLGAEVNIVTEDGSSIVPEVPGVKGTAVSLLQKIITGGDNLPEPSRIRVITCGPKAMMKRIALVCRDSDIPCQVFLERMMACGVNSCKACAVRTTQGIKYVCEHGPLFDAEEVIWE